MSTARHKCSIHSRRSGWFLRLLRQCCWGASAALVLATPISAQQILLRTTLDDVGSVSSPLVGTGQGASVNTVPAANFLPARIGNGVRIDASGEYVRFQQTDGVTQNVEMDRGSADFWFQPSYAYNDGKRHTLLSIGVFAPGGNGIHLEKTTDNKLKVYVPAFNTLKELEVPVTAYRWAAGEWINFRLTWDFGVPVGTQSVRLYVNAIEATYGAVSTIGPLPAQAESTSQYIYIGQRGAAGSSPATGIFDDLTIYDLALPPPPPIVDVAPPSGNISAPLGGAIVSGIVQIQAMASDDVAVQRVDFLKNGQVVASDVTPPYDYLWDTTLDGNASYSWAITIYDTSGNSRTWSSLLLTVDNPPPPPRPDFVLIIADDQRADTMQYMSRVSNLLMPESVIFTNAFVSTQLCCPSRSSILTGLYAHNHGVLRNWANEGGGAPKFKDASTIATWLQQSGYWTALIGKYLNDYSKKTPFPYTPPGWNRWHALVPEATNSYYNYSMAENGVVVNYGSAPQDYSTDVLSTKAVQFIENAPPRPLFLYFAPVAPHSPATPAPIDVGTFAGLAPWRPPSYNEADVSDKQGWAKGRPLLTAAQQASGDALRIRSIEALQAIDRAVSDIIDALKRTGRYQNTVVIYLSDSGLLWGEHRMIDLKECGFEECARIPLWVRVPGVAPRTDTNLVLGIDIAPTIAELAGIAPATRVNGMSLVPLLNDPSTPWRADILLENAGVFAVSSYRAVRTQQYVYFDYYALGGQEFYDLSIDPYQLDNRINDPAYSSIILQLKARLGALKVQ